MQISSASVYSVLSLNTFSQAKVLNLYTIKSDSLWRIIVLLLFVLVWKPEFSKSTYIRVNPLPQILPSLICHKAKFLRSRALFNNTTLSSIGNYLSQNGLYTVIFPFYNKIVNWIPILFYFTDKVWLSLALCFYIDFRNSLY